MAQQANGKTPYKLRADSFEACNCNHGCNCQFAGFPNEGLCEFILVFQVTDGFVGDTRLDGLRAVVAAKYPKAIHEGHGQVVLYIDESASQAQADAFTSILSGKLGGMPWEALAGTVERFEGPVRKKIDLQVAGERSRMSIPGEVDLQLTPLLDPVSGEPKEVHISYPKGGFFWDDARIATTSAMSAAHGDLKFNWPNRYASAAEVNWTNQK